MQAASEVYAKLHCLAVSATQAMEHNPLVQTVKKQLQHLLSTSQGLLKQSWVKVSPKADNTSAGTTLEAAAMFTPRWALGVAMQVMNMTNMSASLYSSACWTVSTVGKMISTLQTRLKNINSKMRGENAPTVDAQAKEQASETSEDNVADACASVTQTEGVSADIEDSSQKARAEVCSDARSGLTEVEDAETFSEGTAKSSKAEDANVSTEDANVSSQVENEVSSEEHDKSSVTSFSAEDISLVEPPIAEVQPATSGKDKTTSVAARPRSKIISFFKRS